MPLDDLHCPETLPETVQHGLAAAWASLAAIDADQIPHHAGGSPAMTVAHTGNKPVSGPGQPDH
jgi:hypothetical protein